VAIADVVHDVRVLILVNFSHYKSSVECIIIAKVFQNKRVIIEDGCTDDCEEGQEVNCDRLSIFFH